MSHKDVMRLKSEINRQFCVDECKAWCKKKRACQATANGDDYCTNTEARLKPWVI